MEWNEMKEKIAALSDERKEYLESIKEKIESHSETGITLERVRIR